MKYSKDTVKAIITLYESGMTQTAIAEQFKTYNTTIRRILAREGIHIRANADIQQKLKLVDLTSLPKDSFWYLIGLLASDGCVTGNRIVLDFSEKNKSILDKINSLFENKLNITKSIHSKYKVSQYRLSFRNSEIVKYLSQFGIKPSKSLTYNVPKINWPYLRGYFDGDGCIMNETNSKRLRWQITSGSIDFCNTLVDFLKGNKIDAKIYKCKTWYNVIVFKQAHIRKIYDNIYENASIFLEWKKDRFGLV